ncbi:hypothetical protein BKA64DRAFT_657234 [Cadophora sp. MPI-SDFR-AT-0126]|nr:hypothetical protein BKA64DRAFT_657234 [Leotiomycetes sp. MPI-SDFR-AT-0126]
MAVMAITALPEATIHLLGSAQALTTPTSLVKELIDNALDAKATSIDILISPNTIDKIEVRDNGHGIPQEDLDALGRRGHTSKLRSFEELKSIGGISLGFRGEALASALQLGLVCITTRTEGEAVATSVQLKAPGGIASQNRTSHPVGTKVSVTKFLHNLPVRRQTAQKDSAKTLKRVKELLQSYAFARPRVRFCLKVASGGKGSWSFAPRPNDGMKEAASQIIGRDAAAQCIEKSLVFPQKPSRVVPIESDASDSAQINVPVAFASGEFTVEVFMPMPKATNIGHGQYISVDSRPVSHDKGTMRKLVSIFKYYAKGAVLEGEEKLKDPFLRLNIKCPVSSYDPNVEPAKDDVIFQDESLVLSSIEQLFSDVYGLPSASYITATPEKLAAEPDNFELLMSRNKAQENPPSSSEHANPVQLLEVIPKSQTQDSVTTSNGALIPASNESAESSEKDGGREWSVDMSKDFSEAVEGSQWPNRSRQNLSRQNQPVPDIPATLGNSLNPWIISKMNAQVRPTNISIPPISAASVPSSTIIQSTMNSLPTPQHSSHPVAGDVEPQSPIRPAMTSHMTNSHDFQTLALTLGSSSLPEPWRVSENLLLSTADQRPTVAESDDGVLPGDDSEVFRRSNDFNSARAILDGPIQTCGQLESSKTSKRLSKPFVPSMRTIDDAPPQDGLRQTTLKGGIIYPTSAQNNHKLASLDPDQNGELAWAMDFEIRKEHASRQRRKELLAVRAEAEADMSASLIRRRRPQPHDESLELDPTHEIIRSSPHKNRYNAAIANLEAGRQSSHGDDSARPTLKTSLPDGDPRAYLMKRQKSMQPIVPGGPTRAMRAKSSRLPLERIPEAEMLHSLVLKYPVDSGEVHTAFEKSKVYDAYVNKGSQTVGLSMKSPDAKLVLARLQAVVEKWMEKYPGKAYEVEYMFDSLINVQ